MITQSGRSLELVFDSPTRPENDKVHWLLSRLQIEVLLSLAYGSKEQALDI